MQFGSIDLDDVVRVVDVSRITARFELGTKWKCMSVLARHDHESTLEESTSQLPQHSLEVIPSLPLNDAILTTNGPDFASAPSVPMQASQNDLQSAKPKAPAAMSWAKIATPKVAAYKAQPSLAPVARVNIAAKNVNKIAQRYVESSTPIITMASQGIEDLFSSFDASNERHLIKTRGLRNTGNMCFMNSVLQPLLHCTPFFNLIKQLGEIHLNQKTPLIKAFCSFFGKFERESSRSVKPNRIPGTAIDAEDIYDALRTRPIVHFKKGRQEDAEEFLGFILDGLHEELLIGNPFLEILSAACQN
ncbi:hypothetical protein BJ741DRAFT_583216 [Chytriomyces cf. hyalinus JEL632]|nr:hypothetical protein BJ741DRAFT_583216 [Chytriomyces cf. hyalinus JEL632]